MVLLRRLNIAEAVGQKKKIFDYLTDTVENVESFIVLCILQDGVFNVF
jgi:hypothetical protein